MPQVGTGIGIKSALVLRLALLSSFLGPANEGVHRDSAHSPPASIMCVFVISDPHFAGPAEIAKKGWERRVIQNPMLRQAALLYRRLFWLADPTAHNHQVDAFVGQAANADWVVANGDYSCDSAFIGLADPAARASAAICLEKLRRAFKDRILEIMGDHEFGKMSLFGGVGGPRIESWKRCTEDLALATLWKLDLGSHTLLGVTSSLLALPMFEREMIPAESADWRRIRQAYMVELGDLIASIPKDRPVVLFCHDPSALPFLARETATQPLLSRIQRTIVGHLHSPLILRLSRILAGMPEISAAGQTARRLSGALRKAKDWAPFHVTLCPSPAGIQLLKDGGYLELIFDETTAKPPEIIRHRLPWR